MVESIRNQNDYDASVSRNAGTRWDSETKLGRRFYLSIHLSLEKMKLNTEDASLMIALHRQWRFSRGYRAF